MSRALGWIVLVLLAAACTPPRALAPPSPATPGEVTGLITQMDGQSVSVRALDGRQFIFWITETVASHDSLAVRMASRTPLRITYVVRENRLLALTVSDAAGSPGP